MIPKKIHYCWFGKSELPPLYKRCLESWDLHLGDYEILRWDESNVDMDDPFIKYHYLNKNWAFISDYVRLQKLHEHGGIYLDTDIEVIRDFDDLLVKDVFLGQEIPGRLNTAVLGCQKGNSFVQKCLLEMGDRHSSGKAFLIAPELATFVFEGNNSFGNVTVMPVHSFYPYNPYASDSLGVLMYSDIKKDTYAIHHWGKAWNESFIHKLKRKVLSFAGK